MNGDTLMAVLVDSDDDAFYIIYPLLAKTQKIVVEENVKEIMTTSDWCPLTDTKYFPIYKSDVIAIAPLNDNAISYYKQVIDEEVLEDIDSSNDELTNVITNSSTIH